MNFTNQKLTLEVLSSMTIMTISTKLFPDGETPIRKQYPGHSSKNTVQIPTSPACLPWSQKALRCQPATQHNLSHIRGSTADVTLSPHLTVRSLLTYANWVSQLFTSPHLIPLPSTPQSNTSTSQNHVPHSSHFLNRSQMGIISRKFNPLNTSRAR